ncbi:peptidoglycan DD-metalloendopeptidase family protein [Rhodobacteraceae bacterium HSP-20]|uniref:Peptidoglycan DD-metalloendopeptidase family protein n=1 Tax=Paragemmobacter amnigenus TaxID=2852097 RepID=A0ABS6J323_9RHOB|nr:peptidoglycan DD-metalloendopeptidase family protein [Rhodobacter amnigenus]MBU9698165.1 peptidoglycan DD-metalloendopeptidase family protein [Rhodobacter amnigenus]MBV4389392.1 peptidoglycan DD-metalloendopeptidase family protein [Rhodobacter amnigenus]
MTDTTRLAARLNGQPDLYAALRAAIAGTGTAPAIPDLIAACDAPTAARLGAVDAGLLAAIARKAATGEAVAGSAALRARLATLPAHPLFLPDPAEGATMALPTTGERPDMPAFSDRTFDAWFDAHRARGIRYGLGLYGENRTVYATPQFADAASPERRTIHLGIDVFAPVGTPVHAPLAGRVRHLTYNADPLDYGNTLILEHDLDGMRFFTLYGHLAASLPDLHPTGRIEAGQTIAHLGDWPENGGWAAHIHFQIVTDLLATSGNFFGVGHASLRDVWSDISPDANLLMRLPAHSFTV